MFHITSQFNSSDGTPRQGACCWSPILNSLICIAQSYWDEGACYALWPGSWLGGPWVSATWCFAFAPSPGPLRLWCFWFCWFYARPNLISTQAALNLHRAILSNMTMFSCSFAVVFGFGCFVWCVVLGVFLVWCVFLFRVVGIVYGQILDCVRVHALFWHSQWGGLACFCTIRLYKDEPVLRPGKSQEGDGRKKKAMMILLLFNSI